MYLKILICFCQAVIDERGPVQNKEQSSNKEKATRKSTMNASTNVNYNDFQTYQGNHIVHSRESSNIYL